LQAHPHPAELVYLRDEHAVLADLNATGGGPDHPSTNNDDRRPARAGLGISPLPPPAADESQKKNFAAKTSGISWRNPMGVARIYARTAQEGHEANLLYVHASMAVVKGGRVESLTASIEAGRGG